MKPAAWTILFALIAAAAAAQSVEITSWLQNTTGRTGYGGLPVDVQSVRYSSTSVYVGASGIPAYDIGPWPANPNTPTNQSYLFRIPRTPQVQSSTKTVAPLGAIAVWRNGVPVYNALDAMSYNNQNVWHQNAVVVEAASFDSCLGHPANGGRFHHHQNPRCLYTLVATQHSPILGYAFDGYPIYGPYAFAATDGSGGIRRMVSSYRLRNITTRTSLADGTILAASKYGPPVSATYPLGYYAEDFEYVAGLGDLDVDNGRFAVTPEYPLGTYAYFTTVDADGASAYPYAIGPRYHGVVAQDNLTSQGHVTISGTTTTYVSPGDGGRIVDSLRIAKADASVIQLSWWLSCSLGADDYAVYEGTIGDWTSHQPARCTDALADFEEALTPVAGDRYFLIVPRRGDSEGSYGADSGGTERARSVSPCVGIQTLDACSTR